MLKCNYRIVVDATADFSPELRAQVDVLPMQISLGQDTLTYAADWDNEQLDAFYARLRAGEMPATSQITPFHYEKAFEPILAEGEDILYLCLSSGLSGTLASVTLARATLLEKYPDRQIVCYDTKSATFALGLLIQAAVEGRALGMSMEETVARMQKVRGKTDCWFTVSDLMYLKHGGRISATAALIGSTLRIMPIITLDEHGKLPVTDKVQGRKTAIRYLVRRVQETIVEPENQIIPVVHCDTPEDALLLESMLKKTIPQLGGTVIRRLGPVIGAHTGPGTLGAIYIGK